MPLKMPAVTVALLNYGEPEATLACVASLQALDYSGPLRLVVVDNASPDESVKVLNRWLSKHPGAFELRELKQNLGFSGGNNVVLGEVIGRMPANPAELPQRQYVWVLNNDANVEPGSLRALVEDAETRHRAGAPALVGSLVCNPNGTYQQAGIQLNLWTGRATGYEEAHVANGMPVDALSGASLLISDDIIHRIGLLDPAPFLYFEDVEYSLRAKQAGITSYLVTGSRVFHAQGTTTGKHPERRAYYYERNRLYVMWRHAGSPWHRLVLVLYTVYRWLRTGLQALLKPSAKRRTQWRVSSLAIWDAMTGRMGACRHRL